MTAESVSEKKFYSIDDSQTNTQLHAGRIFLRSVGTHLPDYTMSRIQTL
jgi:hypothetical protein